MWDGGGGGGSTTHLLGGGIDRTNEQVLVGVEVLGKLVELRGQGLAVATPRSCIGAKAMW